MPRLTAEQARAVLLPGPTVAIEAGAGTGKTTVLEQRVRQILDTHGAHASILVCAFTEAAAEELRERIGDAGPSVLVTTLHGWAYRVVRLNAAAFGLTPDFEVYDRLDQDEVWRGVRNDLAVKRWTPAAEALYKTRLIESNAVDYDGLLRLAGRVLCGEAGPAATAEAHEQTRHVIVDEAPDLNGEQHILIVLMAPDTLAMVGDPRQSIYQWRDAVPQVWATFCEDAGAITGLTVNHRSTCEIVELANQIMEDHVPLSSARGPGPPVRCLTEPMEGSAISMVVGNLLREGLQRHEIAVLGRTWRSLSRARYALTNIGYPVNWGGKSLGPWERPGGRILAAWLRLHLNPGDANLVSSLVRGIHQRSTAPLIQRARELHTSVYDQAFAAGLLPALCPQDMSTSMVTAFLRTYQGSPQALEALPLDDLNDLDACGKRLNHPSRRTLRSFRRWWQFGRGADRRDDELVEDAITVTTIHGAKSREWRAVVLVDVDADTFRGRPDAPTEDQNVLYVGVTRARDHLVLLRRPDVPPSSYLPDVEWTPACAL